MRLCNFTAVGPEHSERFKNLSELHNVSLPSTYEGEGLYYEDGVVSFSQANPEFEWFEKNRQADINGGFIPSGHMRVIDPIHELASPEYYQGYIRRLYAFIESHPDIKAKLLFQPVKLDVPVRRPPKLLLLAGNYAEHIIERGGTVAERTETFPYVFMKPPSTTLIPTGAPIVIPKNASQGVDWECELAVVIGKKVKNISEAEALSAVAGYTIVNDISQRQFRPNPQRKKRERDTFFDWQHGKWFDSFCPCGPCIATADSIPDPQNLHLQLKVNGEIKQDGNTGQMIFSVAAVIAFISTFVTLEPGDIISTGTPKGVGSSTGTYLKPGDIVEASIEGIGTLRNPVVAED